MGHTHAAGKLWAGRHLIQVDALYAQAPQAGSEGVHDCLAPQTKPSADLPTVSIP